MILFDEPCTYTVKHCCTQNAAMCTHDGENDGRYSVCYLGHIREREHPPNSSYQVSSKLLQTLHVFTIVDYFVYSNVTSCICLQTTVASIIANVFLLTIQANLQVQSTCLVELNLAVK